MVGRAVVVLILALLVARSITGAVVTVSESDKDPLSVSLMLELSLVSAHVPDSPLLPVFDPP